MSDESDPWSVLGVPRDADDMALRKAYRRRARETHPDRNPDDPDAEAAFKEVQAAWEALSDPALRAKAEARSRTVAGGGLPEDFLDDLASAVERAQNWAEGAVLPWAWSQVRGQGALAAAVFLESIEKVSELGPIEPPPTWLGKRRSAQFVEHVHVTLAHGYPGRATSLRRWPEAWEIQVHPRALWEAGVRTPSELDTTLMQLILTRYAQAFAHRRFFGDGPIGTPAWEAAKAQAVVHDDEAQRVQRLTWLGYAVFISLIVMMLGSAYLSDGAYAPTPRRPQPEQSEPAAP